MDGQYWKVDWTMSTNEWLLTSDFWQFLEPWHGRWYENEICIASCTDKMRGDCSTSVLSYLLRESSEINHILATSDKVLSSGGRKMAASGRFQTIIFNTDHSIHFINGIHTNQVSHQKLSICWLHWPNVGHMVVINGRIWWELGCTWAPQGMPSVVQSEGNPKLQTQNFVDN